MTTETYVYGTWWEQVEAELLGTHRRTPGDYTKLEVADDATHAVAHRADGALYHVRHFNVSVPNGRLAYHQYMATVLLLDGDVIEDNFFDSRSWPDSQQIRIVLRPQNRQKE